MQALSPWMRTGHIRSTVRSVNPDFNERCDEHRDRHQNYHREVNLKLAALMGVSPGECSRRVAQLEGLIRKARKGREVLISLLKLKPRRSVGGAFLWGVTEYIG